MLTVYAIEQSEIYGHGKRAVIWFSGCTLGCPGCINKHLWNRSSGTVIGVTELLDRIVQYPDAVGVTLIGGEPLEQGEELYELVSAVVTGGLDVVLFTGYEPEELNDLQKRICELSSVTIYGRYIESLRDTSLLLRGSTNQRVVVSNKELEPFYATEMRQVEVTITADETLFLGFPEDFLDG